MRVVLAIALLVALAMAGCADKERPAAASGPADDDVPDDVTALNASYVPRREALVPVTGTLHFLERPTLATRPANGTEVRVPLPDTTGLYEGALIGLAPAPASWEIAWPGQTKGLVGNASLWVDVQGTVTNAPLGCFWDVTFFIRGADGNAVGTSVCAGDEPSPVPTGPRRLDFPFRLDFAAPQDATLTIDIYAGLGPYAPGTERVLLVASPEHDSQITFQGETFPIE